MKHPPFSKIAEFRTRTRTRTRIPKRTHAT